MASEEKTSAADIPLKSHHEVTSADEILLESHEEVTSAVGIPLKSHQEFKRLFKFNHRMEIVGTSSTDQQIMDRSDEVSLDINEIATSLRDQLNTKRVFSRACCIYRVPARLRRLNEEAYTPNMVAIGPIHHGKENLKDLEEHKIMYLQQFLEQSSLSVEELINIVKGYETDLRNCYAETIDLTSEDFTVMILLDAVFVITVLLKFSRIGEESHDSGSGDHIFFRPWKYFDVMWDMCLLENQLPFFFLEKLFELYPMTNYTIMQLTFYLLKAVWAYWVKENSWEKVNSSGVLHFVDFLRKCQQPTEQHLPEKKPSLPSAPTVTELYQCGVKFKNQERNSLFDIRFSNGILEIPQLTITAHTETLFRNLQAFEQCHHGFEDKFVSNYISFISFLVCDTNDVKVLARNENLKNALKSDEAVSNLLYNLSKENYINTDNFLLSISEQLNSHCRKRRNKWKATLKQVYFDNPWTAISVAAAAFLLILTFVQTVCSILQL